MRAPQAERDKMNYKFLRFSFRGDTSARTEPEGYN